MQAKLIAYAIGAIVLIAACWFGYKAIYNSGVEDEREVWVAAQAEAERQARVKEQTDTTTSEKVADTTRVEAAKEAVVTDAATAKSVETIRYEYRDRPAPVCRPADRPTRVQAELDTAVDALSAAAR